MFEFLACDFPKTSYTEHMVRSTLSSLLFLYSCHYTANCYSHSSLLFLYSCRYTANCCSQLQASFLVKLKLTLEGLKNSECDHEAERKSIEEALKIAIRNFISKSQKSGSSLDHVKAHLLQLHKEECLITDPSLFNWAEQYTADLYKQSLQEDELSSLNVPSSPNKKSPLFSKEVVYHASLCCRAVTTCDAGNYQKFFKDRTKVPGHSFSYVSISRSKQDRFLIASKEGEESIYYFAFQGELSLEQWPKRFRSFKDGKLNN